MQNILNIWTFNILKQKIQEQSIFRKFDTKDIVKINFPVKPKIESRKQSKIIYRFNFSRILCSFILSLIYVHSKVI